MSGVLHQDQERVEYFGSECDDLAVSQQQPFRSVKAKRPELIELLWTISHELDAGHFQHFFRNFSELFNDFARGIEALSVALVGDSITAVSHSNQSNYPEAMKIRSMKIRSRTEIIVETRRTLIIKSRGHCRFERCEECGVPVRTATATEAAAIAGISPGAIYRLMEAHKIHFMEMPDGIVLICHNSLGVMIKANAAPPLSEVSKARSV